MNEVNKIKLCQTACLDYAIQFGCKLITQISGSPLYICELNKVPTVLCPVLIADSSNPKVESSRLDYWISHYKSSHKVIRIEIHVDTNEQITLTRAIIVSDLVSTKKKSMKNKLTAIFVLIFLSLKGQQLVSNISPGLGNSNPKGVYPFKENVVFTANDGFHGVQLYYTDGNASGTIRLTDIPDSPSLLYESTYNFGGKLSNFKEIDSLGYFFGNFGGNNVMFKTNGTTSGTSAISGTLLVLNASRFFKLDNKICAFIQLLPAAAGVFNHIIIYDPTFGATQILSLQQGISDIITEDRFFNTRADHLGQGLLISEPIVYNNRVYFQNGYNIASMDINGNVVTHNTAYVNGGILMNNKLFFFHDDLTGIGGELYSYDFNNNSISLVKDINPYFNYGCGPAQFAHFQYLDDRQHNKIYFTAHHEDYGNELWVTDGTEAGTKLVKDNVLGPSDGLNYTSYLDQYVFYRGDTLIMFNWNLANEIFETDGIYWQTINYDPGMQGIMEDGYKWNVANHTYAINGGGILYVIENNNIFPIDTLDVNSCGWSHSTNYVPDYQSGWIYKSGCKLYYAFEDCQFTGIELYMSDFICNGVLSFDDMNDASYCVPVSPNPTFDVVSVSIPDELVGSLFNLCDQFGKIILSAKFLETKNTLDLTSLTSGLYFLSVDGQNIVKVQKQ